MRFLLLRSCLCFCLFVCLFSVAGSAQAPALPTRSSSTLTEPQVKRLARLGQVWGFLKYYHPLVAEGRFNWDEELFKLLEPVKGSGTDEAFSMLLLNWINGLGDLAACKKCPVDVPANDVKDNVDVGWMNSPQLSPALQQKLQYVFERRHHDTGRYLRFSRGVLSLTVDTAYLSQRNVHLDERLRFLALFRYWNVIQYFYPYKSVTGRNWNEVLQECLPAIASAKDSTVYHTALKDMVRNLHDSHASYYVPELLKDYQQRLPVFTFMIRGELVVLYNNDDSLAALSGLQKGDVIEEINQRPVKDLVKERWWLTSGSNDAVMLRNMCYVNLIAGGPEREVELLVRRGDVRSRKMVTRYKVEEFLHRPKRDSIPCKILPGNIGYVNLDVLVKSQVDSVMLAMKDTRGIVFNLRTYPNDNVPGLILEYLHKQLTPFAYCTTPDLTYPGAFSKLEVSQCGPGPRVHKPFTYTGKIVVLVNEVAQSFAEWSAMMFQSVPGCVTVGSQTAGADGNVVRINFPGGRMSLMSGLGVYYPDGTPTQRVGVRVDKVVYPTPDGIAAGKDELLEVAIQMCK